MSTAAATDTGAALQATHHGSDTEDAHRLTVVGEPEHIPRMVPELEVAPQGFLGFAIQGHHSLFLPFAQHLDVLQSGVHVAQANIRKLLEAEAGGDKHRDYGLVAHAEVAVAVLYIVLAYRKHGLNFIIGVRVHVFIVGRRYLQAGYRVQGDVFLGFSPIKKGLYRLGVVVDRSRCSRFESTAPPLWPAFLLGGHIANEVADMVAGDPLKIWPVMFPGVPVEVTEDILVVGSPLYRQFVPGEETGDEFAEGLSFRFCYHFSFSPSEY